jgi:glycosyltransferase involved in cell wall biosynthesis
MAQSCDRIVNGLRDSGVVVDLVHFTHHATQLKVETKRNGRLILCPPGNDPSHSMNCLWNLLSAQAGEDAMTHVAAFGGVLPLLAAPVFAAWLGVPLITLIRGNDFDSAVFAPRRADILREALRRSARVCVVSRDKVAKIRALYPDVYPTWIPNGIDLSSWKPLPTQLKRAQEWKSQTVAAGRRVLGMFGQIKQKKGGLFFLEALKASGRSNRFHLLFVGDLDPEITEWLSANHDVAASVYPFVDRYELLDRYPACDAVVIASFYDGTPNVLLEAGGLGIPVLASRTGGMADLLEDGRHGFLFRPGDAGDCRRAIERAAVASDLDLNWLGANCRSLVESELTDRQESERYVSLFLETLERRDESFGDALSECSARVEGES